MRGNSFHVLEAAGLSKSYGSRRVVDDVWLEVRSGEVVGLLGPNGAGKTTTFYMVIGFIRPEGGKVLLDGEDISDMPIHRRARKGITYLPQEPSVFRKLTVEENLLAVLEFLPLAPAERKRRAQRVMGELGISHLSREKAFRLSGGERRRVEIARALVIDPLFILLDEPFAGIDPIAVLEIQRIIQDLKDRGIGVVVSDHNVRETLGVCDRAYILNEGRVLEEGTPEEIVRNERVREVYLGEGFELGGR